MAATRKRRVRRPNDDGSALAAAKRDIAGLAELLPGVESSLEARVVERLAAELDGNLEAPLSARTSAAREIRDAMDALRSRVPDAPQSDRLDELASRRERRVASK